VKTPSWDEILEFLKLDRWTEVRSTGHDFFEKVLPNGEILHTHSSRSGAKTVSPGRFKAILSDQLRVSEAEFWETLRTGKPAGRPSPSPENDAGPFPWRVRAELRPSEPASGRAAAQGARDRPQGSGPRPGPRRLDGTGGASVSQRRRSACLRRGRRRYESPPPQAAGRLANLGLSRSAGRSTLKAVGVPESADPMQVRGLLAGGQMSFEGARGRANAADTLLSRTRNSALKTPGRNTRRCVH